MEQNKPQSAIELWKRWENNELTPLQIIEEAQRQMLKYALEQAEKELPFYLSGNILSLEEQIIKDLNL